MNTRTDLINYLIERKGLTSYLEIGVRNPAENFEKINIELKVGIDPMCNPVGEPGDPAVILQTTSDDYFETSEEKFDLIFIDGDHSYNQCLTDVQNAVKHLTDKGVVVMHDCLPKTAAEALPEKPENGLPWCGEAYRVFMKYRGYKSYTAIMVDIDHGCGIIEKGKGQEFDAPRNYKVEAFLESASNPETASEWLGLITPNQLTNLT